MKPPNSYRYRYKEVRPDQVSFFVNEFNGGEWRTDYQARPVTTGSFVALPTEVYPMYDATVWGRSASSHFAVHAANPVTEWRLTVAAS